MSGNVSTRMHRNTLLLIMLAIGILVGAGYLLINSPQKPQESTDTPVSTSTATTSPLPPVSGGSALSPSTPTQSLGIRITSPTSNQVVSSPLVVKGSANGTWYFEGSFPVRLLDARKNVIATGIVQSQGVWATTTLTPFSLTLTFPAPPTATGTLVFEKDNPSGLPQHAGQLSIPVRFAANNQNTLNIQLYYPNTVRANQLDDACSSDSVIPVNRQISRTRTPIQDTLRLLLTGELTQNERSAGFTSEFPTAGFSLKGATLRNGVLTLEFTEVPGFTTGGACRVGILRSQIEKTALQFAGVERVEFKPATLFQP